MKSLIFVALFALCFSFSSYAQTREVRGVIADTTKQTVPGAIVKLISKVDSSIVTTDINGNFVFHAVKGKQFTLTIASIGYDALKRKYTLDNDTKPANLGTLVLKTASTMLKEVQVVDVNAVKVTVDTTEYKASAYPVRANAVAEEMIKKMPGVDVDANGNVTAQGQSVAAVRINGKDFFGGDVQTATKNLPADIIESMQIIDDYGDQANLTGINTGTPRKIMNFVIRKDRNHGYTFSGTGGDGGDALPSNPGVTDANRYFGAINLFTFRGDQQISVLGSINNTNLNTFSFGGGGGGGFGGGGGRGNGGRAAGGGGSTTSPNGITDARSLGFNFRDEWGKYISVYGSYSFADKTTNTLSTNTQTNVGSSVNNQYSNETDGVLNHRLTWNMEFKPDTINYIKFTPTYSYSSTTTNLFETNSFNYPADQTRNQDYTTNTVGNSNSPNYGATLLYNHRFNGHGRNFSINTTASSAPGYSYQNPQSTYIAGTPNVQTYQSITVNSRTNSVGTNLSYIEPLGKVTYLEGTYAYNHSYTTNNKDDEDTYGLPSTATRDDALSNDFSFNFNTNRFGLNYRIVEAKYNFTLGAGYQSAELNGSSPATLTQPAVTTDRTTNNFIPNLRFVYNFGRNQALNINYNGSSNSPSYAQLNPRPDLSNASYPSIGDPNLQPEFANNYSIRYNKFDIATGNILFANASFTQTDNKIVANTVYYPLNYTPNPRLSGTTASVYANSNNYYAGNAFFTFAKPWQKRKYTLLFNGNASYSNSENTITTISPVVSSPGTYTSAVTPNTIKSFTVTPQVRFRLDIQDVIDAQASAAYGFTKNDNSDGLGNNNFRTTTLGLNGKNYFFTNWTLSYDYTKTIYTGYPGATNPNIFNTYLERRFLKNNAATIRATVNDVFNQNTGYTNSTSGSQSTISNVNRLGRFYLLTLTIRLQKFAGQAPQNGFPGQGGGRRGDGGGRGGMGGGGGTGGGMGGPGGLD